MIYIKLKPFFFKRGLIYQDPVYNLLFSMKDLSSKRGRSIFIRKSFLGLR